MVVAWQLVVGLCPVVALFTGEFSWIMFSIGAPFLLMGGLLAGTALWTIGLKPELQTRWPYRCIRHPYFLGILLMLVGATVMMRSLPALVLLVPAVAVTIQRARREEHNLALQFSDAYLRYQARVPFLIPLGRRSRPAHGLEPGSPG